MATKMGGRPTVLTEDVSNKILLALRAGNYLETSAAYAGIARSTLFVWLKRGREELERRASAPDEDDAISTEESRYAEFVLGVDEALAESEVHDVATIKKASAEQWQAAAWRLERRYPDRWGRRDSLAMTDDKGNTRIGIIVMPAERIEESESTALPAARPVLPGEKEEP